MTTREQKRAASERYRARHPGRAKENAREQARKLRREVLALLGGKCARCGFDDPRALQVDHINGGGYAERRRFSPTGVWRRILRGMPGYQLLCANCNWIKRSENNETRGY